MLSVESWALVIRDHLRRLGLHHLYLLLLNYVLRPVLRVIEFAGILGQLRVAEFRVHSLHLSVDVDPEARVAVLGRVVIVDINLKLVLCSIIQINWRGGFRLVHNLVVFGILT